MDSLARDVAAYLSRVVGAWDEVLVRVAIDGIVALVSVVLFHPLVRIRWKRIKTTDPQGSSVGMKVLSQKGRRALLLNLPTVLVADLFLLTTCLLRGFYLAPKKDSSPT